MTGAVAGAGSALWAERKVRRTIEQAAARLQPESLAAEVGRSARQVAGTAGRRVREAVDSGRTEKQRRESELWSELAGTGASVPDRVPPGTGTIGAARRESASHLGY